LFATAAPLGQELSQIKMTLKSTALEISDVQPVQGDKSVHKSSSEAEKRLEHVPPSTSDLVYDHDDEEPELHARTYFALAAMFFLNLVQVLALQGPPAVVCNDLATNYLQQTDCSCVQLSYIGTDLNDTISQTWVPNALSLVQAVLCPIISSASDTFQARKSLLVGPAIISFIGSAIAPGSTSMPRLIVAQILIGFGFATVPLAYSVPSEIVPRKWRPSK
jgi:hypothetical protein